MSEAIEDHVRRRYDIGERLGKGAYGIVWRAKDKRSGRIVALKKCFDAFRNSTDSQRTFREVQYLQELHSPTPHRNIIQLFNVIRAENHMDIYLVFENMETDLHMVIRANILQMVHKQYIVFQLLMALKYIHACGLIHRDVKPSNVLLNADCKLKLCDFGLCRSLAHKDSVNVDDEVENPLLTDYVATRWYRAPEILLGSQNYSIGIDIWAIGCVLGELVTGKPMFAGTSTMNQLDLLFRTLGMPNEEEIESFKSEYAETMIGSVNSKGLDFETYALKRLVKNALKNDKQEELAGSIEDFLKACFVYTPKDRKSCVELLRFEIVEKFTKSKNVNGECVSSETVYPAPKIIKICISDSTKFKIEDYRDKLYAQIKQTKLQQARKRFSRKSIPKLRF